MVNIGLKKLYEKLKRVDYDESEEILTEFCRYFHKHHMKSQMEVKTFCMVSDWVDTSTKTLVIEFYEFDKNNFAKDAVNHLNSLGENELAAMINKGIHDYRNSQYSDMCDYPEEWVNDCIAIDRWIREHKKQLMQSLYNFLIENEDKIVSRGLIT